MALYWKYVVYFLQKTDDDVENGDTSVKCKEDTTKKGNKRTQPMSEATNKQPKTIWDIVFD